MSNPVSPAACPDEGGAAAADRGTRLVNPTIFAENRLSDTGVCALTEHVLNVGKDLRAIAVYKYRRDWVVVKQTVDDFPFAGRKSGAVITEFSHQARYNLLHWCKNCNLDFHSMLTITYPSEFPRDGRQVKDDLKSFKMKLSYRYPKIAGIWFLEFQQRGAPHFHFLLNLDLSLFGPLVKKRRTRKNKSHTSFFYWTNEKIQEKASLAWYKTVASGDEKHLRAGVCWEALKNAEAAQRYASKHASKPHQKEVPEDFLNVGRFWGKLGDVHLVGGEDPEPMTTEEILRAVGHSAISSKGKIKKFLFDANTNSN